MARGNRSNRPARPNATGRNEKGPPFVQLPIPILESAAYASLDLTARCLLNEVVQRYKGYNNGSLYLSTLDATGLLGLTDKRPVMRAFDDLENRGFLELAKEAQFKGELAAETSRARCWRLTWQAWPECPNSKRRAPTNDWQNYRAPGGTPASRRADKRLRVQARYKKQVTAGHFPGVDFTPLSSVSAKYLDRAGVKITPANQQNDANPPFAVGVKSPPYVDDTMGYGRPGVLVGPSGADPAAQALVDLRRERKKGSRERSAVTAR